MGQSFGIIFKTSSSAESGKNLSFLYPATNDHPVFVGVLQNGLGPWLNCVAGVGKKKGDRE